jgi:PAS domain S-box-containing protein
MTADSRWLSPWVAGIPLRIARAARQLFETSGAVVCRVDEARRTVIVAGAADREGTLTPPWPTLPFECAVSRAVAAGETVWIGNVTADPRVTCQGDLEAFLARFPFRSIICTPLLTRGEVVAALGVFDETPDVFGAQHVVPLRAFADQAALALENAWLAEEQARLLGQNVRLVEALTASEARYRAIVEDQTELVCRFLADGTLTFVNAAYARYFGLSHDRLEGRSVFDRLPDADGHELRRHLGRLTREAPVGSVEHRALDARDETRWLQRTDRAIFDEAGRLVEYQSAGRDVTDRRQLEERVLEAQKMEAVSELAAGIAHDFNNLLTVVMGGSHLLLSDLPVQDPNRAHADAIARAADEAADLVRQLMTFGRRQPLHAELVELDGLLASTLPMLRGLVREDIDLVVEPGAAGVLVRGDPAPMEQVVLNLVLNACDAMPRGGRLRLATEAVTLGPGARRPGDLGPGRYVLLTVQDTGTGMTPETLARLFEPFFTTKGRAAARGRGLGLAVVYGVVRQSGGHIAVESVPGQGSTFTVYLPRVAEPEAR